jgi:hypothetical protein
MWYFVNWQLRKCNTLIDVLTAIARANSSTAIIDILLVDNLKWFNVLFVLIILLNSIIPDSPKLLFAKPKNSRGLDDNNRQILINPLLPIKHPSNIIFLILG